jgi:hypothetical protein
MVSRAEIRISKIESTNIDRLHIANHIRGLEFDKKELGTSKLLQKYDPPSTLPYSLCREKTPPTLYVDLGCTDINQGPGQRSKRWRG